MSEQDRSVRLVEKVQLDKDIFVHAEKFLLRFALLTLMAIELAKLIISQIIALTSYFGGGG
jgi:hypothetical protein